MALFSRLVAIIAATSMVYALRSSAASAQSATIDDLLSKSCPTAYDAGKEQERAHALAQDNRFALAKKAAELYYDCYQQLSTAYARDWAHFEYLIYLSNSPPVADEERTVQVLSIVGDGANQLASATHFSDVRKAALWLRDNVKDEANHLIQVPP